MGMAGKTGEAGSGAGGGGGSPPVGTRAVVPGDLGAMQANIDRLQAEIDALQFMGTLGGHLRDRFDLLADRLGSLGDLVAPLTPLTPEQVQSLRNLRAASRRPDWSGAGRLPTTDGPVAFFGQVLPPAKGAGGSAPPPTISQP